MYYFIMYGSVILCVILILGSGISMMMTPVTKLKLNSQQDPNEVLKNTHRMGKIFMIIGIIMAIMLVATVILVWPNIPGINY